MVDRPLAARRRGDGAGEAIIRSAHTLFGRC
jgi:hypothetical protein